MKRIIVLGLMKCGTMSLADALSAFNVANWKTENKYVGELIYQAHYEGKNLLSYLEKYNVIIEMGIVTNNLFLFPQMELYKEFCQQYPDAFFILNYRDINNHIRSIYKWSDLAKRLNHFSIQDIGKWISEHNERIKSFFYGMDNFLAFDIENNGSKELSDFIGESVLWPHLNKTT